MWLSRNPCLAPSACLMPSPYEPSALGGPSVSMPSALDIPSVLLCRRLQIFLQFYYAVVPGSSSHTTVSHDKSRLTAHYLLSLYSLLILSLSLFNAIQFYIYLPIAQIFASHLIVILFFLYSDKSLSVISNREYIYIFC